MSTQLQSSHATPAVHELEPLFEEAARASGSSRALKAGYLNAIIARWVQTEDPSTLAPALHALLAKEGVKQLVDEQGTPVSAAATQALLAMSYPHPLEVAPEHLEALRKHTEPSVPPAPKGWILTVLVVATLIQAVYFFLADDMRHMFGATAEQLAGEAGLAPPGGGVGFFDRLEMVAWRPVRSLVPWVQVVGSAVLYFFSTAFATKAWERTLVRRGFLGLGVLGLMVGVLPRHVYENCGTLVAALGALLAGWMLRVPKPSAPPSA
ncbi:hypothetical protein D7V77_24955 [Corallococcus sp. CA041A]|uniref:hypothetical protein n=1 Tax=Corallococcus sp. CA041A TaxID=2316727 RepID=UPI000EA0FF1F|nr:hypothetical protein [Corallococcus sp. CA041A]RKH23113.1 hypothetical protein D7V77_24955 [Corallococcus sp. CA041A]